MRSTGHEQQDYYTSIDGNPLKNPTAYCTHYHGYLSERLIKVHRCRKKHGGACARLQNMKGESVRRMNQAQFYDKVIDRMDKMIGAMNKLARAIEAIQKGEQKSSSFPPGGELVVPMNTQVHLEAKSIDSPYGNITIE